MQTTNLDKIPIYYILGIGRSGTTLLTSLLGMHNQVWAVPESTFLSFFYAAYRHKTQWTDKEIEIFINYILFIFKSHPPLGWSFDPEKLKDTLNNLPKHSNYADFCKATYFHFIQSNYPKDTNNIAFILDKNPSYILYWEKILHLDTLHKPKFLLMIRDYRANILSRQQSIHSKTPHTAFNAYRWFFFNKRLNHLLGMHPNSCLLVRYESLSMDTNKQLSDICHFLGIEYDINMLAFHQHEKQVFESNLAAASEKPLRYQKKYGDLAKPVNTTRVEAWKTELPLKDRLIAEYICGKMGKQFGYEPTLQISFLQRVGLFFTTLIPFFKAAYDVYKDDVLFYVSPSIKLRRLKAIAKKKQAS